jgi:hypothetical protein
MSIVRLLAFETLGCGCVAGHYREAGTLRAVTYIEEKAGSCVEDGHRRNHALPTRVRRRAAAVVTSAAPALWHT